MKKIAFLDRDGVINVETNYLYELKDLQFTKNCFAALSNLIEMNFELVIITNQAGIGKGFYTEQQYQTFKKHFLNILSREGIHFLAVLHCPHHIDANHKKYRKDCTYRKPNPGMVFEISKKYDVDFEKSILVGDKLSDITCGKRAGLKNLYLVRSGHPIDEIYENDISIFDDLYAVSKHMKEELGYF